MKDLIKKIKEIKQIIENIKQKDPDNYFLYQPELERINKITNRIIDHARMIQEFYEE